MSESSEQPISRREALKKLFGLGVASTAALVLSGCNFGKESKSGNNSTEVEKGDILPLKMEGEGIRDTYIDYEKSSISRIIVRNGNPDDTKPFSPGDETVRKIGEITGNKLKKIVGTNTGPLFINQTPSGNLLSNEGRQEFGLDRDYYALPVIAFSIDLMGDGKEPTEVNKNYVSSNSISRPEYFGQGLAVGKVDMVKTDKGGIPRFSVEGYICDARAVTLE